MNILLVSGLFSTAESYGRGTATAEIIIMLLVSFILGYLLRYFLSKGKISELQVKIDLLEKELSDCRRNNGQLTADLDNCCKEKSIIVADLSQSNKDKSLLAAELDKCNKNNLQLSANLEECIHHKTQLMGDLDNFNNQKMGLASVPVKKDSSVKDDLKKIEGIGPKIEELLYAEEIYTWDDLAKTEVKFIQAILDKAGPRFKVHNPESWPFQAAMAANGEWEKLEKWQEEHKGGRF